MAVPLEPEAGLFPDTFLAPFVLAPEVEELATLVIDSCSEFEPIATAKREGGLSIVHVFETKSFDPTKEEFKPHTIAKVTKAPPIWRALTTYDLAIQFRLPFWEAFDERQRQAVLHHELSHIDIDEPGDDRGIAKFSLRPHDVEDFARTIRRFGAVLPGRATFFKAFLDWQHEQERPEPTPLRAITEAVVESADMLQDTADKLRGDITISAGGKSRTVRARKPNAEAPTDER